ncbi:MAG TPA: hypothetical protein VFB08_09260 [Burkholderiales bacterium]|nr:hypothetical protein [Burkholderiales bacterium]
MKTFLLTLALALAGCAAGLALAEPPAEDAKVAKKATDRKPAPRDATIYREDVSLEEMQRFHN